MHLTNAESQQEKSEHWCIITGAASGFGRALAVELAKQGQRLLLADVDNEGLSVTQKRCRAAGAAEIEIRRTDVKESSDWQHLLEFFTQKTSAQDRELALLINNAGVASAGQFEEIPLETIKWTIDTNLMGVILGCHTFLPLLRRQGRGQILNVASAAGLISLAKMSAYNASKAAVISISETIAAELHDTKITVTVVCPAFFQTNLITNGRTTHESLARSAQHQIDRGPRPDAIARRTLKAVRKGQMYCLPMWDAWLLWYFKRAAPELFQKLMNLLVRWIASRGQLLECESPRNE